MNKNNEKFNEYRRKRWIELKSLGLCFNCRNILDNNHHLCISCSKKRNMRRNKFKERIFRTPEERKEIAKQWRIKYSSDPIRKQKRKEYMRIYISDPIHRKKINESSKKSMRKIRMRKKEQLKLDI